MKNKSKLNITLKDSDAMTFEEMAFDSMTSDIPKIIAIKRDGSFRYRYLVYFALQGRVMPGPMCAVMFRANDDQDARVQIESFRAVEPSHKDKHEQFSGAGAVDKLQAMFQTAVAHIFGRFEATDGQGPEDDRRYYTKWWEAERAKRGIR